MNRIPTCIGWCLVTLVAAATPAVSAQRQGQAPRVGYAWPSGGQRGTTFDAVGGGQYLRDVSSVVVSGGGVQVTVTDQNRPLTGKEMTQLRGLFQEARKKHRALIKPGKKVGRPALAQLFLTMAKEKGLTEKQVAKFHEYMKRLADPKRQLNPQLSESIKIQVSIAADARPGLREMRLATKDRLSNPIRFHVGRLPECRESEPNDKAAAAMPLPSLPVVVNGQIMPGDVDRFRFTARQGQRLVVDVSARELVPYLADAVPGWFQATVALHDANGREVAFADDYRFDPDPVLLYYVPRDGDYVLEIRDSIYRGREDFVYRIAVGELPFVTSVFPMGARAGQAATVAVDGWNLTPAQRKLAVNPAKVGLRPLDLGGNVPPCRSVPFAVGDLPESAETEPNDTPPKAAKVTLPLVVNGRIDRPGDWDVFRFSARRGDRIVAEVHARRLGSPLDSLLKLTHADGRALALNDDHVDKGCGLVTHHADSLLSVTIPKTGDYLLWIGDTQHKGGMAHGYRLRVSPRRPDFELRVAPSAINARGGTTVPVTVVALRRDGFAGAIALQLKDPPKGFRLAGARVPAGAETIRMTLTVPAKPAQGLTRLVLEGSATIDGREVRRRAVPADDTMQAFLYRHLVAADAWTAAVAPVRWAAPPWKVVAQRPVVLKVAGRAQIRLQFPRRAPRGQVRLELDDPPDGIAIGKVTPGANGIAVVLRADAKKAKPGVKGNLIINAFLDRKLPAKDGKPERRWRVPLGTLPAVPFEVVGE